MESVSKEDEKERIEELKKFFSECLDKSINYNNAIISVGFISFFATLLMVKDFISSEILSNIVFWSLISLSFYITWIILNMMISSIQIINVCWKFFTNFWKRFHLRIWPIFLFVTIAPSLYALWLLLKALLNNISFL